MKDILSQILSFYFRKMKEPTIDDITVSDNSLKESNGCCFVTLYLNGEVRWSAGNIKEIHPSLCEELIANTIQALTKDKRFSPLTLDESENIKFRIDKISNKKIISEKELKALDPVKHGIIAIKRDYEKLACILPNMSAKLLTGSDFIPTLLNKLEEKKFNEKEYILYQIETEVESNY